MGRRSSTILSDRELVADIARGKVDALGQLYDRYARLVFALGQSRGTLSEVGYVEQVFDALWRRGQRQRLPLPLVTLLTELAARYALAVAAPQEPASDAEMAPAPFPILAPFACLEPFARDVLVMMRVAGLQLDDIVAALEVEPVVVRQALGTGLRQLRQAQETNSSEASAGDGHLDMLPGQT